MPVPRAARLASRKSVIPDPSLYGDPSDDSDEASPPLAPNPPIKTTTITTSSKGKARASTTTKAPSTTTNGKRKSNRSGTESLEEPQDSIKTTKQSSRPLNDTPLENDQDAPRTNKQSSSKRKRVEKGSEEDTSGQQDESSRLTASTKPTKSKGTSKRTKTNQQMVEEEEPEVEGASQATPKTRLHTHKTFMVQPRAATSQTTRPTKPPPEFSAVLDGSDDDTAPFLFTTNPPTPHAAETTGKRPATKPKQNPKGKAPRIQSQQEDEPLPDDQSASELRQPPIASTSRVKLTPPRLPTDTSNVAITTHETPVQIRNVAFRQGAVGTPGGGTAGKSARRNSNGSARRGSSIGGGFAATPHPEIANGELWRSTDPLLPIASRTRTIISWATQRDRTRLFDGKQGLSEAERVAKEAIDGFIEGICDLSIDTSVPFRQVQKPDPAQLPPHPQNLANTAKKVELQTEFGAIAQEQDSRQATSAIYSELSTRRATAREELSTSELTQALDAVSIAETFDLSRTGPRSLDEALEMGRTLLAEAESKRTGEEGAKKKDRRKSNIVPENGETALDSQIRESLDDTAHLQQLTHRLSGFTRVVSRFIDHRSAETHRALTSQSLQGLESNTATGTTTGSQDSTSASGGAGLTGIVGVVGNSTAVGGGVDPLDLLRAISRADSSRR
ncbi:uncharacterized protein JCM6883_001498 [Sporobolomyces salmoneus]|uniref:uncharacterized protein n=1 Tax=Sporobolomyces salmoneus TaxID=183962 RepID=UPI00317BE743